MQGLAFLAAAVGVLGLASGLSPAYASGPTKTTTIVLVHGAFVGLIELEPGHRKAVQRRLSRDRSRQPPSKPEDGTLTMWRASSLRCTAPSFWSVTRTGVRSLRWLPTGRTM